MWYLYNSSLKSCLTHYNNEWMQHLVHGLKNEHDLIRQLGIEQLHFSVAVGTDVPFSPKRQYNLHVQDWHHQSSPILLPLFSLLRTSSDKEEWDLVGGEFAYGYCTDHSQLRQALSFIMWGWMIACWMEWDSSSITSTFYASTNRFIKNKLSWCLCFLILFNIFITGIS